MSQQQYFADKEQYEVERKRLDFLESLYDPVTIKRFGAIQIADGWNCLEVGAGGGSVAKWLANKVGSHGKVVATDINPRFLQMLNIPNLEVRQHNIVKDDLEINKYDLVHSRCVLQHLTEYDKAFKRMVDAARPGGWIVIEEPDYGTTLSIDITDPRATTYVKILRTLWDGLKNKGIVDAYFGRRVRGLIEQFGLVERGHDGYISTTRSDDPVSIFNIMTFDTACKPLIAAGLFSQQEVDVVHKLQLDPTFYRLGYTNFGAWGRKPVK